MLRTLVDLALRPDIWLVLCMVALALFWTTRRARAWFTALTIATLIFGFVPIGPALLHGLESRHPFDPPLTSVDGILQLGGSEDLRGTARAGLPSLNAAAERTLATLTLARRFPQAQVIFTGGGSLGDLTEADVARAIYEDLGLDLSRVRFEDKSRTTAENAINVGPPAEEIWLLVTSAAHMPRALATFRAAGWTNLIAYPVDPRGRPLGSGLGWDLTGNLLALRSALHELVGAAVYRWREGP